MLSIAVLAIGASGVMAMQRASIQGDNDAHMLDLANAISHEWLERVQRDSFTWTQPDPSTTSLQQNWTSNTYVISQIATNATAGTFVFPKAVNGSYDGFSPAADILGRDVALSGTSFPGAIFCTQLRADWLVQDQLLRVTARTFWLRQLYAAPLAPFCTIDGSNGPSDPNIASQIYHFVYATTAIRRNPGQ
jgi:hypothetical protein